jgi:hypothetical protein
MIFTEDYPKRGHRLPRALAAQVVAQVDQPANLARQDNPAYPATTEATAITLPSRAEVRPGHGKTAAHR